MKKLFALLFALVMVLSLAACGGNDTPDPSGSSDNTPSSSEQPSETPGHGEDETPDNTGDDENPDKEEESKTLAFFRKYLAGSYTLELDYYGKQLNDETHETETVASTGLIVGQGEKRYRRVNGTITLEYLVDGEYEYELFADSKFAAKKEFRIPNTGITFYAAFALEESDYYDMLGSVKTKEIRGKVYTCEAFNLKNTCTYCYDGDTLVYILVDAGGIEYLVGVKSISTDVDTSLLEIPADYTVK